MKDLSKYQGILPAFYACYDEKGEISPPGVRAFAEHLLKKGVKGLYVGGSSGECIYQSPAERKLVLENVMAAVGGRLTVIAHVGGGSARDGMELAAHAESLGVDAVASIPPIYFRLPDYAIADYWNQLSSAAPNTDFILYNIPQLAGTALTLPLLREMRKNPRVIGVKNSSMPVQDIQLFKAEGGDGFVVFNGPDEQLLPGLAMGADGGIGGTYGLMPELFLKLFSLFHAGELDRARELQYALCQLIYSLCACRGSMYAVIKELLRRRDGLDLGGVRSPLPGLVPEDEPRLEECAHTLDRLYAEFLS